MRKDNKKISEKEKLSKIKELFLEAGFIEPHVKTALPTHQSWRGSKKPQLSSDINLGHKNSGSFTITTKRGDNSYTYKFTQEKGVTRIELPKELASSHNLSETDKEEIKAFTKLLPGGHFFGEFSLEFANEALKHEPNSDFSSANVVDKNGIKCTLNDEGKFEPQKDNAPKMLKGSESDSNKNDKDEAAGTGLGCN